MSWLIPISHLDDGTRHILDINFKDIDIWYQSKNLRMTLCTILYVAKKISVEYTILNSAIVVPSINLRNEYVSELYDIELSFKVYTFNEFVQFGGFIEYGIFTNIESYSIEELFKIKTKTHHIFSCGTLDYAISQKSVGCKYGEQAESIIQDILKVKVFNTPYITSSNLEHMLRPDLDLRYKRCLTQIYQQVSLCKVQDKRENNKYIDINARKSCSCGYSTAIFFCSNDEIQDFLKSTINHFDKNDKNISNEILENEKSIYRIYDELFFSNNREKFCWLISLKNIEKYLTTKKIDYAFVSCNKDIKSEDNPESTLSYISSLVNFAIYITYESLPDFLDKIKDNCININVSDLDNNNNKNFSL